MRSPRIGQFRNLVTIQNLPWMEGTVASEELRRWPLMHGTLADSVELEEMRIRGLTSPAGRREKATSSTPFDVALGRTQHVFLAPLSFRGNYGFGAFILVDPVVLEKEDVWFADQDIKEAIECIKVHVSGGSPIFWRVKSEDSLKRIIASEFSHKDGRSLEEMTMPIVCSQAFRTYYDQFYRLDDDSFFKTIQTAAEAEAYTLIDYFNRTGLWPLEEEILVPDRVEPEYLLGYWNGGNWTRWASATSSETQQRTQRFIDALKQLTRTR
jgi:hypothetical protein